MPQGGLLDEQTKILFVLHKCYALLYKQAQWSKRNTLILYRLYISDYRVLYFYKMFIYFVSHDRIFFLYFLCLSELPDFSFLYRLQCFISFSLIHCSGSSFRSCFPIVYISNFLKICQIHLFFLF